GVEGAVDVPAAVDQVETRPGSRLGGSHVPRPDASRGVRASPICAPSPWRRVVVRYTVVCDGWASAGRGATPRLKPSPCPRPATLATTRVETPGPMARIDGGELLTRTLALQGGFDQLALMQPITKWAHRITQTARIPDLVTQALRVATTGRPGPVFLEIPIDVLFARVDEERATVPAYLRPEAAPAPAAAAVER